MKSVRFWASVIGSHWGNDLSVYGYNVVLIGDLVCGYYDQEGNTQEIEKSELERQKIMK